MNCVISISLFTHICLLFSVWIYFLCSNNILYLILPLYVVIPSEYVSPVGMMILLLVESIIRRLISLWSSKMNQPLGCAVAWVMRGTWTKVSEADAVLMSEDHTQKLTDKRAILATLIWKVSKIPLFLFLFLPYIFFHTCLHFSHPFISFIFH